MTTHVSEPHHHFHGAGHRAAHTLRGAARFLVPLGRLLFVAVFLLSSPMHFTREAVGFAAEAGVPLPGLLVPLSGLCALLGGLSILFGYHAKLGAWLLILFLLPITLTMHAFWKIPDPMVAMMQRVMFMKNLAILGGSLLLTYFGAGPISIDSRHHVTPGY